MRLWLLVLVLTLSVLEARTVEGNDCMVIEPDDALSGAVRVLAKGQAVGDELKCLIVQKKRQLLDGRTKSLRALSGKFEHDGGVLYFETVRGGRTPLAERFGDPGAPRYQVDVCFRDSQGEPLGYTHAGEDVLIPDCVEYDAETEDAEAEQDALASEAGQVRLRAADSAMADAALAALQSLLFKRAYRWEHEALVHHARALNSGPAAGADPYEPTEDESGDVASATRAVTGHGHVLEIWRGNAFHIHGIHHSATRYFRRVPSGSYQWVADRCNHGRCPGASGMWYQCAYRSVRNRAAHVHLEACGTWYDVFSRSGGHNCNDDTLLQYYAVKTNQHYPGNFAWCDDPWGHIFAPWPSDCR